jgi:hypothetical protein
MRSEANRVGPYIVCEETAPGDVILPSALGVNRKMRGFYIVEPERGRKSSVGGGYSKKRRG